MKKVFTALLVFFFLNTNLYAKEFIGGLRFLTCSYGDCMYSYLTPVFITDSKKYKLITNESPYHPSYISATKLLSNDKILISSHDDCIGDNSFEQCMILSKFDTNGNFVKNQILMSNYRQENSSYELIESSMFPSPIISTNNNIIEIAINYPTGTILFLTDRDLNIISEKKFSENYSFVAMDKMWAILNDKTDDSYVMFNLQDNTAYKIPLLKKPGLYIYKITSITNNDIIVFYNSITGLMGSLETNIEWLRIQDGKVVRLKSIIIEPTNENTGFPMFTSLIKNQDGWIGTMYMWKDFGGERTGNFLVYINDDLSNIRFYKILNSFIDEFYDEPMLIKDRDNNLYFPLITDSGISLLTDKALAKVKDTNFNVSYNDYYEDFITIDFQNVNIVTSSSNYITPCDSCINFNFENIDVPISTIESPTLFYVKEKDSNNMVKADLMCYGYEGSTTYCGIIFSGKIMLYDNRLQTFVDYNPDEIDNYKGMQDVIEPKKIMEVTLCNGDVPIFDNPLFVQLFSLSIPEETTLSEALKNGNFILSIFPWYTPLCR